MIAQVAMSTAPDVEAAVVAAEAAFPAWSAMTVRSRVAVLHKYRTLVAANARDLADLVVLENGKNLAEALASVAKGNETVEWACGMPALGVAGNTLRVSGSVSCADVREPLGIVACICPFNFPAMVPMWTVPIALALGNVVIVKPSEKVPLTFLKMALLMKEAGLPDGVLQVVNGGRECVEALCDHPRIAGLTFVGSSKVAQLVATRCRGSTVAPKRCLALGGAKNHLIALPDCVVEGASSDIVASFAGCAGQRCMAASVLLLVGEQPALVDAICRKSTALVAGTAQGQVGAIIDAASVARIVGYINAAVTDWGATVLVDGRSWASADGEGGGDPSGHWVGPTVLLFTNPDAPCLKEEIFGPVLSVLVVPSAQRALEIENGNPYGNAASIYTENGGHAEWFATRFRAGMIGVNIGVPVPREPFSFGGLPGTLSNFGDGDITGKGAMNFFSNKRKITSKYFSRPTDIVAAVSGGDAANFVGRM